MNRELNEGVDYYFDGDLLVFTEIYHLRRGYCCGNRCRHCPYRGTTKKEVTSGMVISENNSGDSLHFRPYEPTDYLACLQAFESNVPKYFTSEEIVAFGNFLNTLPKREGLTQFYVAVLHMQVIGAGGFGDKDQTGKITLAWGFIHADFHKKGFGVQLLKFRLHQIGQQFPGKPVYLDTTQYTYPFFEKYGFKVIEIIPDYYEPGMDRYDMVREPEKD